MKTTILHTSLRSVRLWPLYNTIIYSSSVLCCRRQWHIFFRQRRSIVSVSLFVRLCEWNCNCRLLFCRLAIVYRCFGPFFSSVTLLLLFLFVAAILILLLLLIFHVLRFSWHFCCLVGLTMIRFILHSAHGFACSILRKMVCRWPDCVSIEWKPMGSERGGGGLEVLRRR